MHRRIQISAIVIITLLAVSTALAWVTTHKALQAASEIDEVWELKHEAGLLVDEFTETHETLSRLARTYTTTGNAAFARQYGELLAMRNGERPWPDMNMGRYWHLASAGVETPPLSGPTVSLIEKIEDAGLTQAEQDLLEEATNAAQRIIALEIRAMEAVKSTVASPAPDTTTQAQPTPTNTARARLFSAEYLTLKAELSRPLAELHSRIDQRFDTAMRVAAEEEERDVALQGIGFATMAAVMLLLTVFLMGFCIRPLRKLTGAMTALADGAPDIEVPCQNRKSEFGILARQIAAYKANSDKIAELGEAERESKRAALAQNEQAMVLQSEVERTVTSAMDGDFTARIELSSGSDAGHKIAELTNALMIRFDAATGELVAALTDLGNGTVDNKLTLSGGGRFAELEATADEARLRLGELIGKMEENAEKERANIAEMRANHETSLELQSQIDTMLSDAEDGNLDTRVSLETNNEGAIRIADGMNRLVARYDETISELILQFTALGEGNLTRALQMSDHGRFGDLKKTARRTRMLLIDLIESVSESAESVQTAVRRLRTDANTVSTGMQSQAAAIEETSSATTEMTDAIKDNAASLDGASQLANTVDHSAAQGAETVSEVVSAVEEIKQRSDKIAEIVSIIENISFQTNLLALNATVEAARAGESGRGFAVVASEVRNLSLRASNAATDIASLINATTQSVDQGVDLAHQAGTALGTISGDIGDLRAKIAAVSASGREQAATFLEVEQAITEISSTTQTTAGSAEESAELADSLVETASTLSQSLSRFRLPNASFREEYVA